MSGQIPGMTTQLPRLVGRSAGAKRSDPDFRATEAGHTAAARALGSLYLTGAGWRRTPTRQRGGCGSPANPAITLRGSTSPISCSMAPAVRRIRRGSRIGLNRRRPSAISSPRSISGSASTKASGSSPTQQATHWLRRAAEGVPEAQYMYGRMLAGGHGVPADPEGARLDRPRFRSGPARGAGGARRTQNFRSGCAP
jgi:hypothetical protein